MKKLTVEIEVYDDFEPCTTGCEDECPFAHWDDYTDSGYTCGLQETDDNDEYTCLVKKSVKQI